jgi:hypothetical protein
MLKTTHKVLSIFTLIIASIIPNTLPASAHGIPLDFSHYIVVDYKEGRLSMIYNIFFAQNKITENYQRFDENKDGIVDATETAKLFDGVKDKMKFIVEKTTLTPLSISNANTLAQVSDLAYPFVQFTIDFGPIDIPQQTTKFSATNKYRLPIEDYQEIHFEFIPSHLSTSNIDYYDDYTINGKIKEGQSPTSQVASQDPKTNSTLLSPSLASTIKKGEENPTVADPNLDPARTKTTPENSSAIVTISYNWWYVGFAVLVLGGWFLYKRFFSK